MPNPLVELLNEVGENTPVTPPVAKGKRPVSDRVKAELPSEEPEVPVASAEAEPPVEPAPASEPIPDPDSEPVKEPSDGTETGASPTGAEEVGGAGQSTVSIYYHIESPSGNGNLAAVRRVGFNYSWNYTVIHIATRTPLGVTFRSLPDAEEFMNAAEEQWDWSFRTISAFGGNGITQEALFHLAGELDGADMFGNLIRSSFHVENR